MDIYSSPERDEYVAGLREEAERTLAKHNGWTKDAVNELLRVDSVIRETMRVVGLGDYGMPRLISDPKGVTLSGGLHIPYGVRVVVPTYNIQTDPARFDNPLTYDGFRFSRPREAINTTDNSKISGDKAHLDKVLELKNQSLIVTTDDFFTFGAQRHACKSY
jgi:cytochrome P450